MCTYAYIYVYGPNTSYQELGIPLATEKIEGASISLTFLGIVLDTSHMKARLPDDKLQCIQKEQPWL